MKAVIKDINKWISYFGASGSTTREWVLMVLGFERRTDMKHCDVMKNLRIGGWSHSMHYNGDFRLENTKHAHEVLKAEVLSLAEELDSRLHQLTAVENELSEMLKSKTDMKNYHNEQVAFTIGQNVTHVTDDGSMVQAIVKSVGDGILDLTFDDGEEGSELASTCF